MNKIHHFSSVTASKMRLYLCKKCKIYKSVEFLSQSTVIIKKKNSNARTLIPLEKKLFIRLDHVEIGQTELETKGTFNIEKIIQFHKAVNRYSL